MRKKDLKVSPCFHHFAFVIQGNEIVEWVFNKFGTPPFLHYAHEQIHAEYAVIKKSKGVIDRRKPIDIVAIRLNNQGVLRDSRPCSVCAIYLEFIGCRKIWYSTSEGKFKSMKGSAE